MKLILLIAILVLTIASAKVFVVKKNLARSVQPEDLALELKVYGTCQEFIDKVVPGLWISSAQTCHPILTVDSNPDVNDLNAHMFCTRVSDDKSVVHFVEVFQQTATNIEASPKKEFVLSFVPTTPFRVLTASTTLSRRPDCAITQDYCNITNSIVNSCTTNQVTIRERYVINQDRIYITANGQVSHDCKSTGNVCCNYISPVSFKGICGREGSNDLFLRIPERHHHHEEHHEEHHNEHNEHHNEHNEHHNEHNEHNEHHNEHNEHHNEHNEHHGEHHGEHHNEHNNHHGQHHNEHNNHHGPHHDGDKDGDWDRDGERDGDRNGQPGHGPKPPQVPKPKPKNEENDDEDDKKRSVV